MALATCLPKPLPPVLDLDIESLKQSSWMLRPISEAAVTELMRSIRNTGLLQPILVQKCDEGYRVVFGSHRLEACRRLGVTKIPAVVSCLTDEEAFLARVAENLVRNTYIDPVEEARGYKMLLKNGWTINAIAKRVGKCDSYVCERLAMLDRLDPSLLSRLAKNNSCLTPSHAELISRISDKTRQNALARIVEQRRLSVRSLEGLLNGIPLPTNVRVGFTSGRYHLCIPDDFARIMKLSVGQSVCMHMHGKELVIRKTNVTKRTKM